MGGQERKDVGVGAVRGRHHRVQQLVVLSQLEHRADRALQRAGEVIGMVVERTGHHPQEALQLGHDHRLGQRLLGADLVVDRLPAHAHCLGQSGHRHVAPPDLSGHRDRCRDDAPPQRLPDESTARSHVSESRTGSMPGVVLHEQVRTGPGQRPDAPEESVYAEAGSNGTKSAFSRTPQSGQDQSTGMSTHAVPAAKPSCSSPAATS